MKIEKYAGQVPKVKVGRPAVWPDRLRYAADIVASYDTGVTLRQLFYRLVSDGVLTNEPTSYNALSKYSAEARREGWFPDLIDHHRQIHQYQTWTSPDEARQEMVDTYRRDRTEGQPYQLWLAVEKAGMVEQLLSWFGELGIPIVALGGYGSQTYKDQIRRHVESSVGEPVLIYAGDFDATGVDIPRNFVERTDCWSEVELIALTGEQVEEYDLPINPGKEDDPRTDGFVSKYGESVQVELDALDPNDLRQLYQEAIDHYWEDRAYNEALDREATERNQL